MSHLAFILVVTLSFSRGVIQPDALREAQANHRDAWQQRIAQFDSVSYEAKGREVIWSYDKQGVGNSKTAEIRTTVRMIPVQLALRMDVQRNTGSAALLVLDKSGFHMVTSGEGDVDSDNRSPKAPSTAHDTRFDVTADYSCLLPFLLGHGIVPLPPNSHQAVLSAVRKRATGNAQETIEPLEPIAFADGAIKVQTNSQGAVTRFAARMKDGSRVEVRLEYADKSSLLGAHTTLIFGENNKIVRRLDIAVTNAVANPDLDWRIFARPRGQEEAGQILRGKFAKAIAVKEVMDLDEVVAMLQEVFGRDFAVMLDPSAHDLGFPPFVFDSDAVSVQHVLYDRLSRHGLDFCFEPQGIVVAPRSKTWLLAEHQEYAPRDFGITPGELSKRLYRSVTNPDEWSDVGGQAQLMSDPDSGNVMILHRQSEHLKFKHTLEPSRRAQ